MFTYVLYCPCIIITLFFIIFIIVKEVLRAGALHFAYIFADLSAW
jgi:hypothetical protein